MWERCSDFEGRVELVKPGVVGFVWSVDRGRVGDVKRGLVNSLIYLSIQSMRGECLYMNMRVLEESGIRADVCSIG